MVVDSTIPAGYWRFLPSFRDDYISLDKMTLGNYLGVCAVIYLTLEEVRLSKTRGHPYSTRCRSCLNLIHTRQAACQDTRPIHVGRYGFDDARFKAQCTHCTATLPFVSCRGFPWSGRRELYTYMVSCFPLEDSIMKASPHHEVVPASSENPKTPRVMATFSTHGEQGQYHPGNTTSLYKSSLNGLFTVHIPILIASHAITM